MCSTIETTDSNILAKIENLRIIINVLDTYELDEQDLQLVNKLDKILRKCKNDYEVGSIKYLLNYYKHKYDDTKEHDLYKKYMQFITYENIVGRLTYLFNQCQKLHRIYKIDDTDFLCAIDKLEYTPIYTKFSDKNIPNCENCGTRYSIDSKRSEYVCCSCGYVEKLLGVVFEDEQFFFQEGQRTKHGKYDPTKHCKFWVDRIQAKENTDIPKTVIYKVKKCIKRDNIWLSQLTCPMIRRYLKELKLSKWNDHVPLILKTITGKEPEQLTEVELKKIYSYFSRVIHIYNRTKPTNKPNCPYHPFFIYKILEQILKEEKHSRRRENILSYIHLQSRETLIENDRIWKPICEQIEEFTYQPTEKNK